MKSAYYKYWRDKFDQERYEVAFAGVLLKEAMSLLEGVELSEDKQKRLEQLKQELKTHSNFSWG